MNERRYLSGLFDSRTREKALERTESLKTYSLEGAPELGLEYDDECNGQNFRL